MRNRMLAAVSVVLAACPGSETPPTLTISPSGNQTATGPVTITASPFEIAPEVTWSISGPGTLSGDKGQAVTYTPPVPATTTPATVTASARGQTATVTFTGQTPQLAKVVIPALSGDVSVTYDQYDIPHIFCGAANDCYAVQGYLQAQDRLFQMDLFRRTAEGRLAELVGPPEVGQDEQFLTLFVTRDGQRIEQALAAALDANQKAILDAFSAGVNAYIAFLKQNPTLMPGEYAQISAGITPSDIPDWTPADTLAIGRLQQFQLSETIEKETAYGEFAATFGPGAPHQDLGRFGAYAAVPRQPIDGFTLSDPDTNLPSAATLGSAVAPSLEPGIGHALGVIHAQMEELNAPFGSIRAGAGSNNWVVAGAKSAANGQAMVANDPHLPLQYPPLFHLFAMSASDGSGLNVTGGTFPGIPGALIGRGNHVGWGDTVVGYDVTDLYQDTLASCGQPVPCVNGVPLLPVPFDIKVRGAADVTGTILVVRQHGPIIAEIDSTHVISMRWTGHEVTQDVKAFLDLNNASAVGDFSAAAGTAFAALQSYSVGAQNFILADDQGNIGYDPHALVPARPWATTHLPWFPLPGDGSAEWGGSTSCGGTGAGAPAIPGPCWVPDNQLPRGVNPAKGYYATANSDPAGYTATANAPFGTGSGNTPSLYLSFDWDDPTDMRYARIASVLQAKTTGGGKVSLADMQALQTDHVMLLAKVFEQRSFYPDAGVVNQPTYTAARQLLQAWSATAVPYDCPTGLTTPDPKSAAVTDAPTLTNSAACLLFHTFLTKLLHDVFDDDFAVVAATTGESFGGDIGAEIRALVVSLLPNLNQHSFCDDVDQSATVVAAKTCGTQVVTALSTAFGTLVNAYGTDTTKWLWGRVHTLTTESPAAPLISHGFGAGPFARPGGALTVDVGNPSGSQSSPLEFAYGSGSNLRFISVMDPSAANAQVKMQRPGPERDAPFGVFSSTPDLLGMYVQNQYFDFLHGHQIDNKGVSAQGFSKQ